MKITVWILATLLMLVGCQEKRDDTIMRVGTIAGPETELMEVAAKVAKENDNITIKVMQFTDYVMPNQALADGSLDANVFQHQPYLDESSKAKGFNLVAIGKTFVYPMGLYSDKVKKIEDVPENAIIAIPNDPSNGARALIMLEKAGLIKLKEGKTTNASLLDIVENPKNINIKEIDAAQLTRIMPDVHLAAINTNYSLLADLFPNRDAIFVESADSPYANIIVVRAEDANNYKLKKLVQALQSKPVLDKANELFKGQAIPAWPPH